MGERVPEQNTAAARVALIDLKAQLERLKPAIETAIGRVLAHGQYILGPEVAELERELAAFCGVAHAVTCGSGTDALLLVLMAEGVAPGDAVFVPSFTFVSAAEVVALLGATPVFVDVEPNGFLMAAESLEGAIAEATKLGLVPRAAIPADLFGQPADYASLGAIAAEAGILILADAAHSLGASRNGIPVGALAPATATSFFPAKPLGCYGDGGAVLTNDSRTASTIRSLRAHGRGADKYDNVRVGLNSRLDTIQAAILIEKLKIYRDEIARRESIARRYNKALDGLVATPQLASGATSVWAQYTVRSSERDRLARRLRERGISTGVYYPRPLHLQPAYAQLPRPATGLPVSERLAREVLSIPMHPYLDEVTQDRIVATIREAV